MPEDNTFVVATAMAPASSVSTPTETLPQRGSSTRVPRATPTTPLAIWAPRACRLAPTLPLVAASTHTPANVSTSGPPTDAVRNHTSSGASATPGSVDAAMANKHSDEPKITSSGVAMTAARLMDLVLLEANSRTKMSGQHQP